uniref:Uncharacterized protein n=1 Tax=Ciona savignyi TaxID=51511 RepID=H2YBZ6_CIOSA
MDMTTCQQVYVINASINPTEAVCIKNLVPDLHKVPAGSVVIVKDALAVSNSEFLLDSCSRTILLPVSSNVATMESKLPNHIFPNYNVEKTNALHHVDFQNFPFITANCKIPSFVLITGVVCGTAGKAQDANDTLNEKEDSSLTDVYLIVQLSFKVKLQLTKPTLFKHICDLSVGKAINCSSLNGKCIGPLACFVYKKSVTPFKHCCMQKRFKI